MDGGIFYSAGNRFKKHAQHAPVLERPPGTWCKFMSDKCKGILFWCLPG